MGEPSEGDEPLKDSLRIAAESVDMERVGPFSPDRHAKPKRVKILKIPSLETDLIFKGCRSGERGVLDMFCDTLYARLGIAYGVPTPQQVPINHEDLGLGVVSRQVVGSQGIQAELDQLDNRAQIPILVTFEEWIHNHDDKADHFWTVEEPQTEVWIVDHGHTIPRHPHLTGPQKARESSELEGPASNNNHFYDSVDQVQPGIDVIESAEEDEITDTIQRVIEDFRDLESSDDRLDAFLDDVEGYGQAARVALERRKADLQSILRLKYDR